MIRRWVAVLSGQPNQAPDRVSLPAPGPTGRRLAVQALFGALAFALLTVLVQRFDTLVVAALAVGLVALVPLFLRPALSVSVVVFLLYTNVPVIAYKYHGVPQPVAGAFLLLLFIPLAHQLVVRDAKVRTDGAFRLMLLFLLVLLVATLRAQSLDVAFDRIVTFALEGLLLYWLILNVVRNLTSVRRFIHVLLAAGALLSGLSLYQEVTGDFEQQFGGLAHRNYEFMVLEQRLRANPDDPVLLEQKAAMTDGRSRRAEGPMDEPNAFAQILLVLLPLALYAFRTAGSRRGRIWAAAAGLLILGGVVITQSRGAVVALTIVVGVALAIRWIRPAQLLPLALAVVLAVPFLGSERLVQRVTSITNAVAILRGAPGVETDHAIRGRATEMLAAWLVFRDYPLVGVGPGQYEPFYSLEYQQKNPRYEFKDLTTTRRAHSLYLELAAELGAIGLAAFLAIVYVVMRGLWRERRRWAGRFDVVELHTALWLSLVGYLASGIFLHLMYERYFWILLALAGAALAVTRAEVEPEGTAYADSVHDPRLQPSGG